MKKLHSIKIKNKMITCVLAILMLCNFVMPKIIYANITTNDGGKLFESLVKFTTFFCDKAMLWLQNTFTSADDIENEDGTYNYKYSPAIIFSGTVPALDINFIDPGDGKFPRRGRDSCQSDHIKKTLCRRYCWN